jgi:NTE family protein
VPGLFNPYQAKNGRFLVDGGLVNPVPVSLCRALGADVVIAVNLNSQIVGKHIRGSRVASEEFTAEHPQQAEAHRQDQEEMRAAESDFFKRVAQLFSDSSSNDTTEGAASPPGMMEVMATSINIMQDRITRSRMAGDPADLVLTPRLAHIGLMEYYRAEEAITEGIKTVQLAERQLRNLLGDDIRIPD